MAQLKANARQVINAWLASIGIDSKHVVAVTIQFEIDVIPTVTVTRFIEAQDIEGIDGLPETRMTHIEESITIGDISPVDGEVDE